MTRIYSILSFLLISSCLTAQSFFAPVSSHVEDQIIQGPCYVFSTVAAIEAEFKPQYGDQDFSEWYCYSECVLQGRPSTCFVMSSRIVSHAINYGMVNQTQHHAVTNSLNCPNPWPGEPYVPCIFECVDDSDFCKMNQVYVIGDPESGCIDQESNLAFEQNEVECMSTLNAPTIGKNLIPAQIKEAGDLVAAMDMYKKGAIACFSKWYAGENAHSVYIYGYMFDGGSEPIFYYKDSWPGAAGFKSGTLESMGEIDRVYFLNTTPGIACNNSTPDCNGISISGPSTLNCEEKAVYTVSNSAGGAVNWTVGNGLSLLSGQGTTQIQVGALPGNAPGQLNSSITATVQGCPPVSFPVTLIYQIYAPTGIHVLSPNWNANGETCPNTLLELMVNDSQNPIGTVSYNWNIGGATIVSGQGTNTVFVLTSPNPPPTYLAFSVQAVNGCGTSDWFHLYGETIDCGGGGGQFLQAPPISGSYLNGQLIFFNEKEISTDAQYQLFDFSGRLIKSGAISSNVMDVPGIPGGIYILHIKSGGTIHNQKIFVD